MNRLTISRIFFLLMAACHAACMNTNSNNITEDAVRQQLNELKNRHAPDTRTDYFTVSLDASKYNWVIKGNTDSRKAKKDIAALAATYRIVDSVNLLPDHVLGADTIGVVTISVANIRSEPSHPSQLATQATMGMTLRVLEKKGGWYLIQTPDHYIGWVNEGAFVQMNRQSYREWKNKDKVIFTESLGYVYSADDQIVSDIVGGSIISLDAETDEVFRVQLPDGRKGMLRKSESMHQDEWLAGLRNDREALLTTAFNMLGTPYLWGGTSFKGVDCSGFTKTIYLMNGMILPRDASQQVNAGDPVDTEKDFRRLKPGDLLFFGRKATEEQEEKIVHVGMWIGNNEYIHSFQARVQISSVDPDSPRYDEYNLNRYIRSKRMLGSSNNIDYIRQELNMDFQL
jgi:gamma-D-glutamyl-L-lysine dipeptidyl-peptidase